MGTRRVGIVGGGIVGVALAHRIAGMGRDVAVTVLEKEPDLARHQTGRNSGVVHAGLYHTPGSLKDRLCRRGVELLSAFCAAHGLAYDRCGKVVVALDQDELGRLEAIHRRAVANGVPGVRMVGRAELAELEPHVRGVAALVSPTTAVVDFGEVTRRLAADATAALGAEIRTGVPVRAIAQDAGGVAVQADGDRLAFDDLVICGGLHTDRLARLAGHEGDPRVVPFRGEYYELAPGRRDLAETLAWPGFRRMAARHWRTGVREVIGSLSRRAFCGAARRYVPELQPSDLLSAHSGVRAQAVARDGSLVDDFRVSRQGRVAAIRNAPSPAATSSMAIAEHIAGWLFEGDAGPAPRVASAG